MSVFMYSRMKNRFCLSVGRMQIGVFYVAMNIQKMLHITELSELVTCWRKIRLLRNY